MCKGKTLFGFEAYSAKRTTMDISILDMSIHRITPKDAAQEVAQVIGSRDEEYKRERCIKIQAANEAAGNGHRVSDYFDVGSKEILTLRWQSNNDRPNDWYGVQVEAAYFDTDVVAVMGKILKAVSRAKQDAKDYSDIQPIDVVKACGMIPLSHVPDVLYGRIRDESVMAIIQPAPKASAVAVEGN